jgi:hypothetical protein
MKTNGYRLSPTGWAGLNIPYSTLTKLLYTVAKKVWLFLGQNFIEYQNVAPEARDGHLSHIIKL